MDIGTAEEGKEVYPFQDKHLYGLDPQKNEKEEEQKKHTNHIWVEYS